MIWNKIKELAENMKESKNVRHTAQDAMRRRSILLHRLGNERIMATTEIKFHDITMEDKAWMDAHFAEDGRNACEYTFANNFIWRRSIR